MWQKWLEVFGNRLLVVEKTLLSKATTFQRLSDFLRIRGYPKRAKFHRYNSQGNRSSSLCQHVDLVRELKEPRQFRLWQSDTSTPWRSAQKQKQKHASRTGTANIERLHKFAQGRLQTFMVRFVNVEIRSFVCPQTAEATPIEGVGPPTSPHQTHPSLW